MPGVEPYVANSTAGNSAPVGGRRHHKLKKVSAKTIKKTLKRLGMKPKGRVVIKGGGADGADGADGTATMGGRRRRHTKKTHRRRHTRGLFGMRGLRY